MEDKKTCKAEKTVRIKEAMGEGYIDEYDTEIFRVGNGDLYDTSR